MELSPEIYKSEPAGRSSLLAGLSEPAGRSSLLAGLSERPGIRALRRLRRNKLAMLGLFIVAVLVIVAIFADFIAPYDFDQYGFPISAAPGLEHPLGTDDLGRDVLSRIIYGARISLTVGLISQLIAATIGLTLGLIAGYYRGWVDTLVMRFTDIMFAFPAVLFALVLMSILGRNMINLFIAIGLGSWPVMARLVRSETLSVKEREYVQAARALGVTSLGIILTHVLPNVLSPIIVQISFGIPQAIIAEAFLSFIGVGISPPAPSWGLLLKDGFRWIRLVPHLTLFPGLAISITLLAFNFLGDGLRDALDPRIHT